MSKTTFQAPESNATVADYKAWAQALSDAFTAVGFIKTSDTGQLDISGIASVPSSGAYSGYEIRKLNDSLFATNPILLKIEYGSGTNSSYPGIRLTMGHTTDGAGTLTGIMTNSIILAATKPSTVTNQDCFISAGEGYVSGALWTGGNYPIGFYIARTSNPSTGVPNGDGAHLVCDSGGNGLWQQGLRGASGGKMPGTPLLSPCCAAPYVGNGVYGANIGIFPIFSYDGYPVGPDFTGCAYFVSDLQSSGGQFTFSINGVSRTFISVGGYPSSWSGRLNGNSTLIGSIMVRYE
jgi:hypothetical protein